MVRAVAFCKSRAAVQVQDHFLLSSAGLANASSSLSAYGPWEVCLSIHQRYPRAMGAVLAAVADSIYFLPGNQQRPLAWLHPDGSPALLRHPLNNREQSIVIESFALIILASDVQED